MALPVGELLKDLAPAAAETPKALPRSRKRLGLAAALPLALAAAAALRFWTMLPDPAATTLTSASVVGRSMALTVPRLKERLTVSKIGICW